jgi:hypothetical protein
MVRLPYACALGPDSLLHSLVESNVPVQVSVCLCLCRMCAFPAVLCLCVCAVSV